MSSDHARKQLPPLGGDWPTIMQEMQDLKANDFDYKSGRLPSYTYYYGEDLLAKQIESYSAFIMENGLGAGLAFKSLSAMQADIYDMALGLFNAPSEAVASFTSGGTESLFEALRTARDATRSRRGVKRGVFNVVAATSGHAAFEKAARTLDIEVRRTALNHEYRGTASAFAEAIDDDTIMLYGSAPCYPHGVFDEIEQIGALALERKLWFHVDGCWGGMLSPFMKELGYPIPPWDFAVPGVTSVSVDLHKFGYAVKGASLLMFRHPEDQAFEPFVFTDWPHGTYVTPTFMGSKPAGSVASAWAIMRYLGHAGYLKSAAETMEATTRLIAGVDAIEGLRCVRPTGESNLFTFVSTDERVDIKAVALKLFERGWMRGLLREPLGIQQGVTAGHLPFVDEYLAVLGRVVEDVRAGGLTAAFNDRTY